MATVCNSTSPRSFGQALRNAACKFRAGMSHGWSRGTGLSPLGCVVSSTFRLVRGSSTASSSLIGSSMWAASGLESGPAGSALGSRFWELAGLRPRSISIGKPGSFRPEKRGGTSLLASGNSMCIGLKTKTPCVSPLMTTKRGPVVCPCLPESSSCSPQAW